MKTWEAVDLKKKKELSKSAPSQKFWGNDHKKNTVELMIPPLRSRLKSKRSNYNKCIVSISYKSKASENI